MYLLYLLIVFSVIVILLMMKKPLSLAMAASILMAFFLYRIPPLHALEITVKSTFSGKTLSVIASFYTITYLQRMLEKRNLLSTAETGLNSLFRSRRITCMLAPIIIGLLPAAGAVYICGSIIKSACIDSLSKEDQTFVTSYYRHIPESFLPTYSSILIALELADIKAGSFVIAMLPAVALLIVLGYLFYVRKIPKEISADQLIPRTQAFRELLWSLWTILLCILIVIACNAPVYYVMPAVILIAVFVYRFHWSELKPFFISAFETKVVINTILIMIFNGVLDSTGVMTQIPDLFASLPIPTYLAFALIFFFGSIASGSTAIIVMCLPMAISAIPNGGVSLLALLISSSYCAMQVSPTHICLTLATEYFHTTLGDLIRRTLPVIVTFFICIILYYNLLLL
ncbi:MAG: DUF401 family protein [Brotaphodocola sp.]